MMHFSAYIVETVINRKRGVRHGSQSAVTWMISKTLIHEIAYSKGKYSLHVLPDLLLSPYY